MKPKIKICGITNLIDAKNALNFGADFIGFINISSSLRYLTIAEIEEISRDLTEAERNKSVLLSLENNVDNLISDLSKLRFKTVQPYGNLNYSDFSKLRLVGYNIFKPIQVSSSFDIENLDEYRKFVDLIILDTKDDTPNLGGTGKTFDWSLFVQAKKILSIDLCLSGGLNPTNVEEALKITNANMIDLSSGLEARPGLKSIKKMRDLFNIFMVSSPNDL
jgi:phosphoribosylanthranilate isomerase